MSTINTQKMNALNELIKNFATLVSLAADEPERTTTVKTKGYTVITKKIESINPERGYFYYVYITDGKKTVSFLNHGKTSISMKDLADCENEHGSRFFYTDGDKKLHQLTGFGKRTGAKQQKEELMEFAKSCLDIKIMFADGTLTYSV